MRRAFVIGVALVTLIAVAVIFIAPTIDLPETVLREQPHFNAHQASDHTLVKLAAVVTPHFTFALEEWAISHGVTRLYLSPHIQLKSLVSMRC